MENKKVTAWKNELKKELAELKEKFETAKANSDAFGKRRDLYQRIKNLEVEILPTEAKFCNRYSYSDIDAYEVIEECTPNKAIIRELDAERVDNNGMSDSQVYKFNSNPDNEVIVVRRHKNGSWYDAEGVVAYHMAAKPHKHFDFSF